MEKIWEAYDSFNDLTFIMKSIENENEEPISDEVIGFYWGKPNDKSTKEFIGKLKAEY